MTRRTDARLWLGLAALLSVPACDAESRPVPAPSAAPAPASASAPPPVPSARRAPPEPAACRALVLEGRVHLLGSKLPLAKGSALDGKRWVELEKGAKVTLRHSRSGREVSLSGPALVLPCRDGDEQFLLAKGELTSTAGPGARPGAEVLIATPVGTVRYADASLQVRAEAGRTTVAVRTGTASLDAAAGAKLTGKPRVEPKGKGTLAGKPKLEDVVKTCEAAAAEADQRARSVLGKAGPDAGTLGERAAAHVEARQRARGACTIAATATALAPEAERSALNDRVAAADRRWKSVPRGSPEPGK